MWHKESSLNSCGDVYFLKSVDGVLRAGTDRGVFVLGGDGTWSADPTFPQATFDVLQGTWGGLPFTAWGKNDGVAFSVQNTDGSFTSDHFDPLDGKKVYGLFYGQWLTVSQDADGGNTTTTPHDGLYLCTEAGLFGLGAGSRGGQYSALLKGREMFGAAPLTETATLPGGSTATVPTKIYRIFQDLRPKSVPLIILTSDGVYVVRDWRWADPTNPSSPPADDGTGGNPDFTPEAYSLAGLSCTCYAQTTGTAADGSTVYKNFIGTNQGVYRSYDGGYSWERCERIAGGAAVYTPASDGPCLFAGTDLGLYYSGNDGDDWLLPAADGNSCANFSGTVSGAVPFSGAYLAQGFRVDQAALTKVSLYLECASLADGDPSLGNTLQASVWLCDGNGYPSTVVAAATDLIAAEDVAYPGFYSAFLPVSGLDPSQQYALVARETVAQGGLPCLSWLRSSRSSPYSGGVRMSGAPGNWTQAQGEDFFFRVYEQAPVVPVATFVDAGFADGVGAGVLIGDDGSLNTDFKLATTLVVDDTQSLAWSDPGGQHPAQITALVDTLWARTTASVLGQPYPLSQGDFWVYSTDEAERTSGFTSDLSALEIAAGALFERGLVSSLYDTAQIAISGLGPQSIVDSLWQQGDTLGNFQRVTTLVDYLSGRGLLRLADVQAWYASQPLPNTGWDGSAESIGGFADVANFVCQRWARSFTPVVFLVADGDADGLAAATDVGQTAQTCWGGVGAPVFTYALGRSHEEGGLRTVAAMSGGRHIDITLPGTDWALALASFLPGGDNALPRATWTRSFDFADPTWIREVDATFSPASLSGSCGCVTEFRYTRDRLNWLDWTAVASGVPSLVGDLVLGLEYRVTLTDDWSGPGPVRPVLHSLGHVTVSPSFEYLVTPPQPIASGAVAEYILSAAADVPSTARLSWGIVRGDSTDFADFEPILNDRKAALANRQQSVLFTAPVVRPLLAATSTDNRVFQVIGEDGLPARWTSADQVDVYTSGFLVDPSRAAYALDAGRGLVYFAAAQPPTLSVKVTITTPAQRYIANGEPTSTLDNRTYTLSHGRWAADAQVVVLVNGAIKRGGYYESPAEGQVTFKAERQPTDIVTVFIETAPLYRAGVEIRNYGTDPVVLKNFGLEYSVQDNASLVARSRLSPQPSIVPGSLMVAPASATIYDRLSVNYTFRSQEGNEEQGTQTAWFKNGTEITGYDNRTVERTADVGAGNLFAAGDVVFVRVTPSDGVSTGQTYQSPSVTLRGTHVPYVTSLTVLGAIAGQSPDPNSYAPAGAFLTAQYTFHDADNAADQSSVLWYVKDAAAPLLTGAVVPAGMTKAGQVLTCAVFPQTGDGRTGASVNSGYVVIR